MTKPDLICVWPDTIDFPIFREWVHKERERFSKVIIMFTQTNWDLPSQRTFVEDQMRGDRINFAFSESRGGDWRNTATKEALLISDNEWVFFTEPDFFPNCNLWKEIEDISDVDMYFVGQDSRMHPCCIILKRSILDQTSKDFSANPPDHDHFGQIQKDLFELKPPITAYKIQDSSFYHMNGLSHNMFLLLTGQTPVYRPEEFHEYCKRCLALDVAIPKNIKEAMERYV